jgi:hypothetical protein
MVLIDITGSDREKKPGPAKAVLLTRMQGELKYENDLRSYVHGQD